ncbi:DUF393 domain-containing protein [Neobacillus sp. PS3-34]|uniref:thiol-disulfide oxidoreductase DCC family protein n=1 Tax=Neobacillus sp. PS3-34 TaxID=3070678 RepID=UPI0027E0A445|nr:DUF393 domain-containing protein [Neobacillus sp. PS3-34]WML47245.1 DUF393 domain-containing protein [Neobacillus sp. PS3-34]
MKMVTLYDENCSLCQETKRWFQKLDWLQRVKWTSLQEYEKGNYHQSFNKVELRKELHLILPSGRLLKGFFAVRKLLIHFPVTFIIGLILYIPLMPVIGVPIYKWIAKNRYRFFRKNCDNGSCSL